MKVLFDHSSPFLFAHGGFQIQIQNTLLALRETGVQVEQLRWWDAEQRGDLIHYFGVSSNAYLHLARTVKLPVVLTSLFTETCNRTDSQLARQAWLTRLILSLPFGEGAKQQLAWRTYHNCSRNVVTLQAERHVLQRVYRVPEDKISIVPCGLSEAYLRAGAAHRRGDHLICTGTITPRKRIIELAEMAHAAQTPILFVGKPYHPDDPYWLRFQKLVDGRWVRHHQHVSDESEMISLLHSARGFVLMSDFENWCLSAHEAAACGIPLLVPDLNWSRERFGDQSRYFKSIGVSSQNIEILRRFFAEAPNLPAPGIKLHSWKEVAEKLKALYEQVLQSS